MTNLFTILGIIIFVFGGIIRNRIILGVGVALILLGAFT